MKTAEDILNAHIWIEPGIFKTQILTAMNAYADQAIDKCAEEAETKDIHDGKPYMSHMVVDRDSILKVKELLK